MGRCFQIQTLGLAGNPLMQEIQVLFRDQNGTRKLLEHMLDNLNGKTYYKLRTAQPILVVKNIFTY